MGLKKKVSIGAFQVRQSIDMVHSHSNLLNSLVKNERMSARKDKKNKKTFKRVEQLIYDETTDDLVLIKNKYK
jgi:hypothetical protein